MSKNIREKATSFKRTVVVPLGKFVDPSHQGNNAFTDDWAIHWKSVFMINLSHFNAILIFSKIFDLW